MNSWWYEGKKNILTHMSLSTNAAHIVLGILLFLGAAILARRTKHAPALALGWVLLVQVTNEILDCLDWIAWTGRVNWSEAFSDTVYTLALPVLLALLWRHQRQRRAKANTKEQP